MVDGFVIPLLKILIVLNATLVGITYMVLLERKAAEDVKRCVVQCAVIVAGLLVVLAVSLALYLRPIRSLRTA